MTNIFAFNQINLADIPDVIGVYALFQNNELIYYGRAQGQYVTIKSRLQSHLRGGEGYCTQQATHFAWEASLNANAAVAREQQLLAEYQTMNGRLPRCNQRIG